MTDIPTAKGNNPQAWQKLLDELDEKLQFGLLEPLRRSTSYHFEDNTLFIEPSTQDDFNYLNKPPVLQQLQVFVQGAVGTEQVKLRPLS